MAKILVPQTSSQLSLSFEGKWDWTGRNSIENVSPSLRRHVFEKTQERLSQVFRQVTHAAIVEAIKTSKTTESYFTGRDRRAVKVRPVITGLLPDRHPQAIVGLYMDLRGPARDLDEIYGALLDGLEMPPELRRTLVAWGTRINATVPIFPMVKVEVGTVAAPPTFDSFVLSSELPHVCEQLEARNRPYHIVAAA